MDKIILIITTIFTSFFCFSQDVKIPEPDFSGTIVNVNCTTGNGMPLEVNKLVIKTKASASVYLTGIGKATAKATIKGNTSMAKLKKIQLFDLFTGQSTTQ